MPTPRATNAHETDTRSPASPPDPQRRPVNEVQPDDPARQADDSLPERFAQLRASGLACARW